MIIGLYDDLYNMDFKLKFIFQIIAAKILIDNGLIIENLHGVFGVYELNRIIAQLLTIFIIVAIINSINFIDGIDGLAVSIVLLFVILFEFFSASVTQYVNLSIILIISTIPIIYFNLKKTKKVFLGDSGSHLLGGLVSVYVIFILTNSYTIKPEFDLHKILFIISILFYPIIDIIRIFFLRLVKGMSPFQPDKNHIHHLLLKKTKSHFYTTLIILGVSIFFIILMQIIF
jgi:UDP-N-acetylmuramyl pentapeptide phosphotransferase/UDP-N-acetylglucosamine-1-phosphate transferase